MGPRGEELPDRALLTATLRYAFHEAPALFWSLIRKVGIGSPKRSCSDSIRSDMISEGGQPVSSAGIFG
jgi:hypothetical protein